MAKESKNKGGVSVKASAIDAQAVKYILIAGGAGVGIWFFASKWRKYKRNQVENTSFTAKGVDKKLGMNPEMFAINLQNQLNRVNVDEDEVYRMLESIPSRDFLSKVQRAYQKAYNKSLSEGLKQLSAYNFTFEDYDKAMNIINTIK